MAHAAPTAPSGSMFDDALAKTRIDSETTVEIGNRLERLAVQFFKKDKRYESPQCNGFVGGLRDVIDPLSCAGAV